MGPWWNCRSGSSKEFFLRNQTGWYWFWRHIQAEQTVRDSNWAFITISNSTESQSNSSIYQTDIEPAILNRASVTLHFCGNWPELFSASLLSYRWERESQERKGRPCKSSEWLKSSFADGRATYAQKQNMVTALTCTVPCLPNFWE